MYITRITRHLLAVALVAGMGGMAVPAQAESARACRNLSASTPGSGAYTEYLRCEFQTYTRYTGTLQDLKADGRSARLYDGSTLLVVTTTTNNNDSYDYAERNFDGLFLCTGKGNVTFDCSFIP